MFLSYRSSFAILLLLVLSLAGIAPAQDRDAANPDNSAEAKTKNKAIDLLVSVVGQAASLRSAENRARIRSNAADALWNDDEKRARDLFGAVVDDIKIGFSEFETEFASSDYDSRRPYVPYESFQTLRAFWQLRHDTLARISKHDADLALEFLNATNLPETIKLPPQMQDAENAFRLELARQVVAKNPRLALNLGRESLARGYSMELLSMFLKIQARDKDSGQSLYLAMVDKLRGANLVTDRRARAFAISLARTARLPDADEQGYRDLLGMLTKTALDNGCAGDPSKATQVCWEIGPLFSALQKYSRRAAPLKQWADEGVVYPYNSAAFAEFNETVQSGTADEILTLAGKYPEHVYLFQRAFDTAGRTGDLTKARQIASTAPRKYASNCLHN